MSKILFSNLHKKGSKDIKFHEACRLINLIICFLKIHMYNEKGILQK